MIDAELEQRASEHEEIDVQQLEQLLADEEAQMLISREDIDKYPISLPVDPGRRGYMDCVPINIGCCCHWALPKSEYVPILPLLLGCIPVPDVLCRRNLGKNRSVSSHNDIKFTGERTGFVYLSTFVDHGGSIELHAHDQLLWWLRKFANEEEEEEEGSVGSGGGGAGGGGAGDAGGPRRST